MAIIRALSIMKMTSGIATDVVVNTWHYGIVTPGTEGTTVLGHWQTFMRANAGLFATGIATTGHELRLYDLADTEPRVPYFTGSWSFASAPDGTPIPNEMAVCLSFQGSRESGLPQARRRGRLYLGPLCTAVMDGTPPRVKAANITTLVNAGVALAEGLDTDSMTFGVYSRMNENLVTVSEFWCDNAFDVQRRRGVDATTKTTAAVSL